MIKELCELGKTLRKEKSAESEWIHDALKDEAISMEIVIKPDGSFHKIESFEKKMTGSEAITAKKGKARLLLDKVEEVLSFGGEKSKKKHDLFLEKLSDYSSLIELAPVLSFYGNNRANGVEKALQELKISIPDEKDRKGNMGFRVKGEGVRIHEKKAVRLKIIEKYEAEQKKLLSKNQRICSICGKNNFPVEDIPHGMIKRVPDGQSSGCALVSYNENAFESFNLKGNNNSSICTGCARTYVESFNWLLSSGNEITVQNKKGKEKTYFRYSNRKNFGKDTAMVFWTRNNENLPEMDMLEMPDPDQVSKLMESVSSGSETDSRYLEPDHFYSCTLSGSAARIAVRDWIESSLFDFRTAISKWFEDIAISEYDKDLEQISTRYAGLYQLSKSCQRKNNDGKYDKNDFSFARIAPYLWNGALKNSTPPLWILTKALQRARFDGVSAERAALIKLILNRHKGGDFVIKDCIEEGKRPVAYVCGQIFAKLESVQYYALGNRNTGIRERYFTYAMTLPAAAFGRLFDLNSKHFTKLKSEKPGLAITLDKELQALCPCEDIKKFPTTFTLEEKGQFAIGYYQQRQKQFNSKTS